MEHKRPIILIMLWTIAFLITLGAVVYQNITGPTYPKKIEFRPTGDKVFKLTLPRSHAGESNCKIDLSIPDTFVSGEIYFRRYPGIEEWQKIGMLRSEGNLIAFLPHQPPAGKLEYYLLLKHGKQVFREPHGEQVIIRFRRDVPAIVIIPHVSLMFISMLLSNLTLLLALFNYRQYRVYAIITVVLLFIGGLILGPLVQKFAFGQLWTGFPFGYDLTDNKTLIAFVFWFIALAGNWKTERRYLIIVAALVMLVIFSIPHSLRGSELDPATGKIKSAMKGGSKLDIRHSDKQDWHCILNTLFKISANFEKSE